MGRFSIEIYKHVELVTLTSSGEFQMYFMYFKEFELFVIFPGTDSLHFGIISQFVIQNLLTDGLNTL